MNRPEPYDLIIRNGEIVTRDRTCVADLGIRGGVIAAIEAHLDKGTGRAIFDASGLLVFPGIVDAHVHLNEPGLGNWEGFASGSAALAAGGCTVYADMPLNGLPPTVTAEAMRKKLDAAASRSVIDYALWGGLVPGLLDELKPLAEAGVIGFKAFMSEPGGEGEDRFRRADDLTLYEGMKRIAPLGKVLALHAESEPIVSGLADRALREGRTTAGDYAASRPVIAELEAVRRALFYAEQTGCKLHFVHISSADAVREIELAKRGGMDVTVETCPHYLVLTEEDMLSLGPAAKCAPPLRSESERSRLWEALASETIDTIASDHSPCPSFMKAGREPLDWFAAWGGISGAQSTLELMIDEGYLNRSIPLPLLGRMLSLAPAQRIGLHPRKGEIAVGADADIAVVHIAGDPYRLHPELLHYRHKHSPYVGRSFRSRVVATFCRGAKVYEWSTEGAFFPAGGARGQWIR
ncbi:allantoinase AllB [Paenibacillus tarimensis]